MNTAQPKPTTGEWTAADVLQMGCDRADPAYAIAESHNAALAAAVVEERKRCAQCGDIQSLTEELAAKDEYIADIRTTTYSDLEKQLAAERELRKNAEAVATDYGQALGHSEASRTELLQQLAAERQESQRARDEAEKFARLCRGFKADLAAEREKVQTLVAALTDIKVDLRNGQVKCGKWLDIITDALAKVKEGK